MYVGLYPALASTWYDHWSITVHFTKRNFLWYKLIDDRFEKRAQFVQFWMCRLRSRVSLQYCTRSKWNVGSSFSYSWVTKNANVLLKYIFVLVKTTLNYEPTCYCRSKGIVEKIYKHTRKHTREHTHTHTHTHTHLFQCIRSWFREQNTCPTCRNHALLPDDYPFLGQWHNCTLYLYTYYAHYFNPWFGPGFPPI